MAHKGYAFSVQIYCCSLEIDLLRALPAVLRANLSLLRWKSVAPCKYTKLLLTKIELLRGKFDASPHIIECFSVENSIFLRTNQKLLRGKFDVQIESFPVQNSMLLRTNRKRSKASPWKTTQWIGRIRIPPANKSREGSCVVCKDILSPASKRSRPAFIAANIFKKMLNFSPAVGRSFSTVMP